MTFDEAVAALTGPGAPFEVVTETVAGRPMRNWKNRERSLREKIANCGLRGDQDCMIQGGRRISYGEFARLCFGAAGRLADAHGLRKGDRLAVLAFNSPDWLIALFGAVCAGGTGVGLNGWWATEEIEYGLNDSGSRFLVVDERLWPRVAPLAGRLDALEKIFYVGSEPPPGTLPVSDLLVPSGSAPTVPIDEDDPFVILYTSGTTGRSKGCITTHRGTIAQVIGIVFSSVAGALTGGASPIPQTGAQPASLLTSPLFHVGGLHSGVCTALTAGAKLVFSEGRFDPEQVMRLIQDEKISLWGAIPTMLHRVVHHPKVREYDLSSLRSISFGGAPTAPETIEKAREVLPIEPSFANAYGLTETHGVATVNGGKDLLGRKTSVGRPIPVLELEVVDEGGKPVPDGERGELRFRGATVTPGYWNRPDATAQTVRDGWLYTGDVGYRDAEGFFFVVDRAKDMIIRGGENVYCVEVEAALFEHPAVTDAAAIGIPHHVFGEEVGAVVHLAPGASASEVELREFVATRLAAFKVPVRIWFRDDPLPRNPSGKILKRDLKAELAPDDA
jgi:acyl-CoA synthetase (AMP-forming)/AMP-acid ligase II